MAAAVKIYFFKNVWFVLIYITQLIFLWWICFAELENWMKMFQNKRSSYFPEIFLQYFLWNIHDLVIYAILIMDCVYNPQTYFNSFISQSFIEVLSLADFTFSPERPSECQTREVLTPLSSQLSTIRTTTLTEHSQSS